MNYRSGSRRAFRLTVLRGQEPYSQVAETNGIDSPSSKRHRLESTIPSWGMLLIGAWRLVARHATQDHVSAGFRARSFYPFAMLVPGHYAAHDASAASSRNPYDGRMYEN